MHGLTCQDFRRHYDVLKRNSVVVAVDVCVVGSSCMAGEQFKGIKNETHDDETKYDAHRRHVEWI